MDTAFLNSITALICGSAICILLGIAGGMQMAHQWRRANPYRSSQPARDPR